MSVYRSPTRTNQKQTRDSSTTKKIARNEIGDAKPIITQEKPVKSISSSKSTDKLKTRTEKSVDRNYTRKTELKPERSKKDEQMKVRNFKSVNTKAEALDRKEVSEKRIKQKLETDKITKPRRERNTRRVEGELRENEKSKRERTRTRTLSPREVKQLIPSKMGKEVMFDVGNELRKPETKAPTKGEDEEEKSSGDADEYEEDFENYESDFEEDEEPQLSPPTPVRSPSPPVPVLASKISPKKIAHNSPQNERWKEVARKKEIEDIKKSIEKENYILSGQRISNLKREDNDSDKENLSVDFKEQILDFSKAVKNQKKAREVAASRKRGEELLSMITLDTISYSIFEVPPIPYEEYMRIFGSSNSKQVLIQTNEDDLNEEIQTDHIMQINKWTQHPPDYLGRKTNKSFNLTKEERLGAGEDVPVEEDYDMPIEPKTNGLWNFMAKASEIILTELEKKSGNFLSLDNLPNSSKAVTFGDGFVQLNIKDISFLKSRSVSHLTILPGSANKFLSVHANKEKSFQKSIICVWSFRELSKPLKILIASNRVTSVCFGLHQGYLVFAGLADGSVCLWDLREPSIYHDRAINDQEWFFQSVTYTTAGNFDDENHCSSIVSIQTLENVERNESENFVPMQICSLDQNGLLIMWSVIQLEKPQRNAPSDDLGLAHWGRVKLVKSSSFSVFASLREEIPDIYITCNGCIINIDEGDGFYFANSLGSVHHCSTYGTAMKPKFYVPAKEDAIIEAKCLEMCPFNRNFFLVGCGDGSIRLHSRFQEKPLICLNQNSLGEEKEAAVVSLHWMRIRPCVFFALDSMSRIHVWDLGVSDMYPEISVSLSEKRISCMELLPTSDPRQSPFAVIGTEDGCIEIHRLKKEYACRSPKEIQNETKMFLKYVSIL